MKGICTIITKSHVHYAVALHKSFKRFDEKIKMHVLIVDTIELKEIPSHDGIEFHSINSVVESEIGRRIHDKYYTKNMDHFRWSSKPVFMMHLLNHGIDNLLYLDSDLFFFSNPQFLFEELANNSMLLSPHFRTSDPSIDYLDYGRNNTHGLFNGGFVGANKDGIPALEWWASTCEKVCVKDRKRGYYVDQSHLNLIPILFEKIGSLKHRGCNVASWNRNTCTRSLANDEVLINEEFEIVFIHFTYDTILGILDGRDPWLTPYLKEYVESLITVKSNFNLLDAFSPSVIDKIIRPSVSKTIEKQIELILA